MLRFFPSVSRRLVMIMIVIVIVIFIIIIVFFLRRASLCRVLREMPLQRVQKLLDCWVGAQLGSQCAKQRFIGQALLVVFGGLRALAWEGKGEETSAKGGVRVDSIQSSLPQPDSCRFRPIRLNSVQFASTQPNSSQFSPIRLNSAQFVSIQPNSSQFSPIRLNSAQFVSIQPTSLQFISIRLSSIQSSPPLTFLSLSLSLSPPVPTSPIREADLRAAPKHLERFRDRVTCVRLGLIGR